MTKKAVLALFTAVGATIWAAGCGSNDNLGATPGDPSSQNGSFGPGVNCQVGPNFTGCPCNQGETNACFTGPAAARNVGACHDGVQTCKATDEVTFAFGPCNGEVLPSAENNQCTGTAAPGDGGMPVPTPGPTRHGMVVFGGSDTSAKSLDETWIFDGAAWAKIPGAAPQARFGAMAATLGGRVVVFGGTKGGDGALADTWTFDGTTWTQLAATGPMKRFWGFLAPVGGKLMLFGGIDGYNNVTYGDTWLFDGTTWTQVMGAGPGARYGTSGGPTPDGKVVIFGGENNGLPTNDQWVFDGAAWSSLSATPPSARWAALSMTFGSDTLIAGGCNSGADCIGHPSDTWTFNGTAWMQRATTLPTFWGAAHIDRTSQCGAALNATTSVIAGHGTGASQPDFLQVGIFNGSSWSAPAIPNPPSYRVGCAAATL